MSAPLNTTELALADFLSQHPPDTDLTLIAWRTDGGKVARCELATSPWWVPANQRGADNGRLLITMREVANSEIVLGWRADEIDDIAISTDDPQLWQWGRHGSIFANSAVPNPPRFYAELAGAVQELRYPGGMEQVLGYERLSDWLARLGGRPPFHVLAAPEPVIEAARPFLEAQGVEYVALFGPEPTDAARELQLVSIGESWVICGHATVQPSLTTG